jgi:hypothetical protein
MARGRLSGFERAMAALDGYRVPRTTLVATGNGSIGDRPLSLVERIHLLGRHHVPELLGSKQVAERLGTQPSNLGAFPGLPEAVVQMDRGRLWLAEDVEEYAREREARKAGR